MNNSSRLHGLPIKKQTDYAARRNRIRPLLAARNLDALLVSRPANRFYLSGFELHDGQMDESSGFLVISRDGEDWLATDSRYAEAAARIWPRERVLIYRANMEEALAMLLAQLGRIAGFESDALPLSRARRLRQFAEPKVALLDAGALVGRLREIKEPCEIAKLENSFRLNHNMFNWLQSQLETGRFTGLSEKDVAWEIEKFFRENGAQELAFATIAAFGKNGALPHACPGPDKLAARGPLLVDAGCRVDDYCSDQTRVYWLGDEPSPEYAKALRLTREAQDAAMEVIRPGVACADIYKAARAVFEKAGVEKFFTHSLGHGVGLETHEAPSLSPSSSRILAENMVVTVEPGLYYPEWGGVRWEYTVLVEKDGAKVL